MIERDSPQHETHCGYGDWVRAYQLGTLDEQRSNVLERHVAQCESCGELVDALTLTDPSDAAIRLLASLPGTEDDEPEFRQLESRLLSAIPPLPSGRDEQTVRRLADPPLGPLPQSLGNYELLENIGRGAWGAVYRARHKRLEQIVAVKVLDTSRLRATYAVERFVQEIKAVGQLRHPNIVRATDAGEDRGFHYLVMEFVEGVDAARLLQRVGQLTVADACEIARQAAVALDYAHTQGWVHRDVKPSNLIVTPDGTIKLLDLGVAGRRDGGVTEADDAPLGTADYMAPEQWTNFADVDARADVYSLGCTLFKFLTGRMPYHPGARHLASDKSSQAPPSVTELRDDVPAGVGRLVARMLAVRPEDRIATAKEVAHVLGRWTRRADLRSLVSHADCDQFADRKKALRTLPRTSRRRLLAGAAAVGAGAVLMPWMLTVRAPQLRRSEWRELAPVPSGIWLTLQSSGQPKCEFDEPGPVSVQSEELTLVDLGRAISGRFALEVAIQQTDWQGGAGVFFQGQCVGADPTVYHFHTIELRPLDTSNDPPIRRLLWSRWEVNTNTIPIEVGRHPLAEVPIEIRDRATGQVLRTSFGERGFPDVRWNGRMLHESEWTMSAEARRLANRSSEQASRQFLGRLGLVNSQGATRFLHSKLAYL